MDELDLDRDIEAIKAIVGASDLRGRLLVEFPETFGGLYVSMSGDPQEVTIVVVGGDHARATIEAFAVEFMHTASSRADEFVHLRYASAHVPLMCLQAVQDQIIEDRDAWASRGLPVIGATALDLANRVMVMVPYEADLQDYEAPFREAFQDIRFEFCPTEIGGR